MNPWYIIAMIVLALWLMSTRTRRNSPMERHRTTPCERCRFPTRIGPPPSSDAALLRRTALSHGFCANCAVTVWLQLTAPLNRLLCESPHGPQMLLAPHVQQHFLAIMRAGNADMHPEEIDWDRIVAQWELPLERPTALIRARAHRKGETP